MHTAFRGEAIYTAEVDAHFPNLTVGDTLYFAALARTPRQIPGGISREQYAEHLRDVIMAAFGISHTINSPVGNDFIRGVSGGNYIPKLVNGREINTSRRTEACYHRRSCPQSRTPTVLGQQYTRTRFGERG
jgi:hypothetical protein